ncbi:FAS-associated factor 2-like [Haliotis cracherodii]|uniref:FAS-associated factor 2-like n=1 Tax=Haliotis cracherodii TaxID=6455 RepID=UPI0039EB9857
MADEEDLSSEQTEQLLHFQDLTGIDDMGRCRQILERHRWDIEAAVQDTFNEREGAPAVFNQPQAEPRQPAMNLSPSDQRVFTVERRRPQGIFQWGYFVILFPFRFVYSTVYDLMKFVYRLIKPDPRRNVTDPLGDVERFIQSYREKFGNNHPVFYRGSYSQALNDAKRELKFLLVYLHGEDHQDTDEFCRVTLAATEVTDFVNGRLLFWACSTNSPEGYRVSQALKENTYPFLCLIVLRDNRMTVVARIEGPLESREMVNRLERVMEDNEASLVAARADREALNFNQTLRQEQDVAYQVSLRADQEKERKKREEQEKREAEEQKIKDQEQEQLRLLEEKERQKEELRQGMPAEPSLDDSEAIRIILRVPSGVRLERRFLKTHSMKFLYYFVFCNEQCPDDFQIVTNFPRRTLPCQPTEETPEPKTFAEFGLGKSEMLFVHDNEA